MYSNCDRMCMYMYVFIYDMTKEINALLQFRCFIISNNTFNVGNLNCDFVSM